MLRNLAIGIAMIFGAATLASAANPIVPDEFSPVPGIQVGKVKRISIENLPVAVKRVVQLDIEKDAFAKVRQYGEIPDDAIIYKKNYYANLKDMREIEKNTTFKISNLSKSQFNKLKFEGAYPEGPTKSGPWSSLTRIFKRDDGVLLFLHEWDYVGDGGGVMMVEELMNTTVSDMPARFSVKKSPSGQVLSELIWATEKRYFTLSVLDDVTNVEGAKYNVKWLTGLAGELR